MHKTWNGNKSADKILKSSDAEQYKEALSIIDDAAL